VPRRLAPEHETLAPTTAGPARPTAAAAIAVAVAATLAAVAQARHALDEVVEIALLARPLRSSLALGGLHHAHATHALEAAAHHGERLGHARQAIAGEAEGGQLRRLGGRGRPGRRGRLGGLGRGLGGGVTVGRRGLGGGVTIGRRSRGSGSDGGSGSRAQEARGLTQDGTGELSDGLHGAREWW
jgi:hypothetical protein